MIPAEIDQLLDHMEWADALVWRTVEALPAAAEDERVGYLLHHAHTVQRVYLDLWRGRPMDLRELDSFPDLAGVRAWARTYYAELADFIGGLDEASLEDPVEFPWAGQLSERYGEVSPTSLRQALLQVPMHSHYHRGQINTRIRELGGEPPLTDFVAWTWAGCPGAKWPEDS